METVIKQTEESMTRKLSNASRLHEDYRPLKAEVDLLRRQCLGLERLPDLHEEEGSPITPEYARLAICPAHPSFVQSPTCSPLHFGLCTDLKSCAIKLR